MDKTREEYCQELADCMEWGIRFYPRESEEYWHVRERCHQIARMWDLSWVLILKEYHWMRYPETEPPCWDLVAPPELLVREILEK